jgi:hypothetical protein
MLVHIVTRLIDRLFGFFYRGALLEGEKKKVRKKNEYFSYHYDCIYEDIMTYLILASIMLSK